MATHWCASDANFSNVGCLCIGTGRFLRSVLVPAVTAAGMPTVLVQTRGRTFLEFMSQQSSPCYPLDTVEADGSITTDEIPVSAAYSLGQEADKQAFYHALPKLTNIQLIGMGVTEAGLASPSTTAMRDFYELLSTIKDLVDSGTWPRPSANGRRLAIVDMDNVPDNGRILASHMRELAKEDTSMQSFVDGELAFLSTMVDRITSEREGSNGMVPRAEPVPAKALVVLDPEERLPSSLVQSPSKFGVVIRRKPDQLATDIALKLRVANGTHTAVAHVMALLGLTMTDQLPANPILLDYLDALVQDQIVPAAVRGSLQCASDEVEAVWNDWRRRLTHAHFGLSTFFITQNGAAKIGIRLSPTLEDLIHSQQAISTSMVFAVAVLLRWLTPKSQSAAVDGAFTGRLARGTKVASSSARTVEYADKLRYNLKEGWYEFRCACDVNDNGRTRNLSEWLGSLGEAQQPSAYYDVIRAYLIAKDGGNLSSVAGKEPFSELVQSIATLYARMVAGDDLPGLLVEMKSHQGCYRRGLASDCSLLVDNASLTHGRPLHYRPAPIPNSSALMQVRVSEHTTFSVTVSEVASALAIDLHTHLLPPSHGSLCLWGIDELLTYHYLVAEYFITAPASMSPEAFYAKSKQQQADIIWKALFVERTPVSEACRGVITTLVALGLSKQVRMRDLPAIRQFYATFREGGVAGAEIFSDLVHATAGVRYNVMTNIPFDRNESRCWRPERKPYSANYRSALRVDPLLAGDRQTIENAMRGSGYETTLEGARQFLRDWCDTMKPEYMMASTPHDFVVKDGTLANVAKTGMDQEAMKRPGAFADSLKEQSACNGTEDDGPSVIDENSDFLSDVLMKVCEEKDLPLALKIGAHRGVNPRLKAAGDGVVAFADAAMLGRLCDRFPRVRFLATFLSKNNQHEACVLASKFRNLHIYGCWWFCNNPR